MSDMDKTASTPPGTIAWTDLTIADAEGLRDFYAAVAGWSSTPLEMGGYADYVMNDGAGTPIAGICHARGLNAGVPPAWILYITVEDLDASLSSCNAMGGRALTPIREMAGTGRFYYPRSGRRGRGTLRGHKVRTDCSSIIADCFPSSR
jgi:predicted enzyme related to lactoylglutathione lyase